ncbi:isoprenoid synthase domain-containing protein [Pholiota molesta]|nr:isoprenoid synthase domain-containing protein [Pholiota molesta]
MSRYNNLLEILSKEPVWTPNHEQAILEPFKYITSNPGKEIRGKLIEAFNLWLAVPSDKLHVIAKVVNMLHAASLMVDDIEDDSQLRRGQPVTHKIYGIPQTINTANYVYFLAYQELFALRGSEASALPRRALDAIVTEELLSLHRGQGLEILWRDSLQCPSEEDYITMVNNKTGGLLRIGIKLMMACSTTNVDVRVKDYVPLVNLIGVFFQIRDDLMNLQSTEVLHLKQRLREDLSEGKFSFPVVHGIHADTSNRQILNVLQKRPTTPTLKIHTINYLKNQTKPRGDARLGGNRGLEAIMDLLHVDERQVT